MAGERGLEDILDGSVTEASSSRKRKKTRGLG